MCWVCAADKSALAKNYWGAQLAASTLHFQSATAAPAESLAFAGSSDDIVLTASKGHDALPFDGVGDKNVTAAGPTVLIVTPDDIADDTSSTTTIEADGARIISTINAVGDQDFVKVEFEAGHIYDIGQYGLVGGPSGVPLADAYIELYDSAGNLLVSADGGGRTPGGELYGLDALLTFVAETSGTYYINARAFEQSAADGSTNGDGVGDYELFVDDVTGAPAYIPYYDIDSPLHSIDWGSQVDRTSRNPDGEEGTRPTTNPFTGVGGNPFGIEGKNVITYYFAKTGDIFISENPANPGLENMVAAGFRDWEKRSFELALDQFEKVADVVFVEVDNRAEADFKFVTYDGTPDRGILGRMSPPNEQNEGQAEFNRNGPGWNEAALQPGGFSFVTLIHELGHGMGMSHPHDNGGRSSILRGVEEDPLVDGVPAPGLFAYTNGDYDLNQGVYTMMSYEDGWEKSPHGAAKSTDPYGWLGGPMAFDIAVLQDKYGVNEDWATGDDVYLLNDENAAGTFYSSIWDNAGTDTIAYDGARDSVIDLRAATLQYEVGGGGFISYASGVFGGFTIANGVIIENASAGSGNDVLIGNGTANTLEGGAGADTLDGGDGGDTLVGGAGSDSLTGGGGADVFRFAAGDSAVGSGRDRIVDFSDGDLIDLTAVGATLFAGGNGFSGQAGEVRAVSFAGATIVEADVDGDRLADLQIELTDTAGVTIDDFVGLTPAPAPAFATGGAQPMQVEYMIAA